MFEIERMTNWEKMSLKENQFQCRRMFYFQNMKSCSMVISSQKECKTKKQIQSNCLMLCQSW